nr:uncharacterized protein C2orf42 homolog [Aedes albopictus]
MSFKLDSRWSKRGIKKCPKCGTFNGHRAAQCKNKQCGTVLKGGGTSSASDNGKIVLKSDQLLAVQLQTELEDQSAKLYSIRRLDGSKQDRGFVEIRDCVEGADEQLELKTGICYVDCEPHTDIDGTCQHVRVAAATGELAEGLTIDREVLEKIDATDMEKQEIWKQQMGSGADDPLVQRVSHDTFVVKCYDVLHQLVPYCHVELKTPSSITCDCQCLDRNHKKMVAAAVLSSPKYKSEYESIVEHLLLTSNQLSEGALTMRTNLVLLPNDLVSDCSPALQSTEQFLVTTVDESSLALANTDMQLINCRLAFETDLAAPDYGDLCKEESVSCSPVIELVNSTERGISPVEAFSSSYAENLQLMDCQIELMDQFNLTDQIDFCPSDIELSDDNVVFPADEELGLVVEPSASVSSEVPGSETKKVTKKKAVKLLEVTTKKAALRQSSRIDKEKMKRGSYNVRRLMRVLESNGVVFNRLSKVEANSMMATHSGLDNDGNGFNRNGSLPSFEATLCNLSFTIWLESVIEQLNSVIQYGGDGKPEAQVFSIHENFFQCLRARFSVGHRLRTPDHSVVLEDGPRKGLTCQIYKFTCYKSLRNVFKTDKTTLQFEKSFCRSSDGTFEEIDLSESLKDQQSSSKGVTIKPFQYKTYIKMGSYRSAHSKNVHYFTIEWIAGVLPKCRFGELRITFQYGHKENHLHVRPPPQNPISGDGRDISASNEVLGCKQ